MTDNSKKLLIPQLFMRLSSNEDGSTKRSYIVALPDHYDWGYTNTAWQDNPTFPAGEIHVPGIDILSEDKTWVFDSGDEEKDFKDAMLKMKELWSEV